MVLTPITYFDVRSQKQCATNKKLVAEKPYARFFQDDMQVPLAMAKALQHGQMPRAQTLTPSLADIKTFLSDPRRFPDAGYAVLEGPTAYVQTRHEMPGVTSEMFKWWFLWHPIEKQRYMLWFPYAHVENYVEDPRRLADESLSYEQRLYHNPNTIGEYIGPSTLNAILHFSDPTELGCDATTLKRAGFTASASAWSAPCAAPDITFTLMLHLGREADNGLELFNRYWIGAHPELKRFPGGEKAPSFLKKMGLDQTGIENIAYEMAVHDMTEFSHLASVLPRIYGQFGPAC